MKLAIFSDVHYCSDMNEGYFKGVQRKLVQHTLPIVDKLINTINNSHFDAAIFLGDFIEDVFERDQDIINLEYISNILDKIKPPLFKIPGNHDLRTLSVEDVKKVLNYKNLTYSKDICGYHLVFISVNVDHTASSDAGGILRAQYVSNEDLEWLSEDLAKNNLPSIIFTHFGIANDDMENNFWFENKSDLALFGNKNELKKNLEKDKNLISVFSGHQHWTKDLTENGVDYHLLGSLIEDINSDGIPDGVWFEVDLDGTDVNIVEHHVT